MNTRFVSSTDNFHFRRLTPGVYAALARPQGKAASNCGIISLGEWTVVVDTSLSPQAAMDLRHAALELTGRDANLIFLTHHHLDHIGGCAAFSQTAFIFSSMETYKLLNNGSDGSAYSRESVLAAEEKPVSAKIRLPDFASEGQAVLYGQERVLEFTPLPRAHCSGNALVYLPQEGVLFAGDLLFARRHPYLRDGDPQGWLDVLDSIEKLLPQMIVPGHGGVSSLEEIRMLCDYLHAIMGAVREFVQAGRPPQALHEIRLPQPFDQWEPKTFLAESLEFLYARLLESGYVQREIF
jgi:cyclase